MSKEKKKGEFIQSKTEDSEVYNFIDEARGINIKSREVFLKKKIVAHYPFTPIGKKKYKNIDRIEYHDMVAPLPRGINKVYGKGYGFTKVLSSILYALQEKFDIERIVVSTKGKCRFAKKTVYLNYNDLDKFYPKSDFLLKSHTKQKNDLALIFLNQFFPKDFKKSEDVYIKGSISSLLSTLKNPSQLSKEDMKALLDLSTSKLTNLGAESKQALLATKEKIDTKFLEDAVEDFKKMLTFKPTSTIAIKNLEKKWEKLLKENSWIISNLFSLPVFLFANQAYVGGKEIFNSGGKVTDFLFKNSLTDNLTIIELKTHRTELLFSKPYRGKDVFSISKELSGSINQVLDQRQNLLNDFHALRSRADHQDRFNSFNSRCLIIVGNIRDLPPGGEKSFELFRSNLHGVEVITFDEVLQKIESFTSLIKKTKKVRSAKSPSG